MDEAETISSVATVATTRLTEKLAPIGSTGAGATTSSREAAATIASTEVVAGTRATVTQAMTPAVASRFARAANKSLSSKRVGARSPALLHSARCDVISGTSP